MLQRIVAFIKKEMVLCIAAVCAAATMLLVPPDAAYAEYIDIRVLCLLFSLMAVVAGFQACGVFRWLTQQLLKYARSGKTLGVALVLLPFFTSMLVTNDVALLIFVPFTLGLLGQMGCHKPTVYLLVLQTIAANLGSMATPVGNPQNLYLYASYNLTPGAFFAAVLPIAGISLVALSIAALPALPKMLPAPPQQREKLLTPGKLALYAALFVLCLLTVFRVIPYWLTTAAVAIALLIADRRLLRQPDYALLLTFVCFFIVSGNLGRVQAVNTFLQSLLQKSTLFTAALSSQVISNVPAAVLLSGFTSQWKPLLQGVNIGGLGTPIASLASLITLKLYMRHPGAQTGKFLLVFTLANVAGLAALLAFALAQ